MSRTLLVFVYPNGIISQGPQGVTFQCNTNILIKIKRDTSLDELRQFIHRKLKLQLSEVVSQLIYRIPARVNPLIYNSVQLSEDEDVEMMFDFHTQLSGILTFMEVYAKIETIETNLNEQVHEVEDCRPSTSSPSNHIDIEFSQAQDTRPSHHPVEVNVHGTEMPQFSSFVPSNDPNYKNPTQRNADQHPTVANADIELSALSPQNTVDNTDVDNNEDVAGDTIDDSDSWSDEGNDDTHPVPPISYYSPASYLSQINTKALDKLEIPGLVQASSWSDDSDISIGLLFPDKDSLMLALKMYSIKRHKDFKVERSTTKYVDVKCRNFGNGCSWKVRACLKKTFNMWMITRYGGDHTCVSSSISQDHNKLDSDIIAGCIMDMVNQSPDVPISKIVHRIKDKLSYIISNRKAWIGKQKAIAKTYGNWEASYDLLRYWMAAVKLYMPGTVVEFQTRQCEEDRSTEFFHRVFWAYKPCIDSFKHLKPMIQIDRTFLYGKYRGTLLIAIAQDGNRHIVPIAFAIVEGETLEAWSWFLELLRCHVVKERSGICLISDKHPSILTAISNEHLGWQPPLAYHFFCIRHLACNLNSHHKNEILKTLFVSIGYQYEQHLVDQKMRELRSLNEEAANWINEIPKEKWCCAYDVDGRRYGHMTTNVAECMNNVLKGVRNLPITSLVQATMYKVANHFVDRRTKVAAQLQEGQIYCELLRDALRTNQSTASAFVVRSFNKEAMLFEVEEPYNQQHQRSGRVCKVLLNNRRCDCGEFQALRYPCSHVIAACAYASLDHLRYVDPIYKLDTIANAYHNTFHPIGGEQYWPPVSGPKLVPNPNILRLKGRPRSTWIQNETDMREPGEPPRCSLCGETKHNRKTCPNSRRLMC